MGDTIGLVPRDRFKATHVRFVTVSRSPGLGGGSHSNSMPMDEPIANNQRNREIKASCQRQGKGKLVPQFLIMNAVKDYGSRSYQHGSVLCDEPRHQQHNDLTVVACSRHQRLPPLFSSARKKALWAIGTLVLAATMWTGMIYIPMTREEQRESTTARQIRKAQRIADSNRERLLNAPSIAANKSKNSAHHDSEVDSVRRLPFSRRKRSRGNDHESTAPEGCEATIIILRHCEKGHIREHCDFVGYERSVFLSTLFGQGNERWPAPSYIFALGPGNRRNHQRMNFREIETVGPLSQKTGVLVDDSFTIKHTKYLAQTLLAILQSGDMCGKVAVISWKHSDIGPLAHELGCGPLNGCPYRYHGKTFDEVWQIKFVHRDFKHSVHKSLKLGQSPQWKVFGSVQQEGFDPLAFSKLVGDYPPNGNSGKEQPGWRPEAVEIAERTSLQDTDDWIHNAEVDFLGAPRKDSGNDRNP